MIDKRQIELDILLDGYILKTFCNALPFGFIGQLACFGQIVLMIGVLYMGEKFGPFPNQMGSSSEQVPGGPHIGRINIGHGNQSSSEQSSYLIGVYFVVLCLASMDGFHV